MSQEHQSDNSAGSGCTVPAGAAQSGGAGWAALADAPLPQSRLPEGELAAAVAVSPSLAHLSALACIPDLSCCMKIIANAACLLAV